MIIHFMFNDIPSQNFFTFHKNSTAFEYVSTILIEIQDQTF